MQAFSFFTELVGSHTQAETSSPRRVVHVLGATASGHNCSTSDWNHSWEGKANRCANRAETLPDIHSAGTNGRYRIQWHNYAMEANGGKELIYADQRED